MDNRSQIFNLLHARASTALIELNRLSEIMKGKDDLEIIRYKFEIDRIIKILNQGQ